MTLGEKIRKARREKKLTQAALCGDKITRNMLSAIECGKASPSLETVNYIADKLSLPVSYLMSDDDDLFFYAKRRAIKHIKAAYKDKKFIQCVDLIKALNGTDDELSLILANSYFELGKRAVLSGSLASGKKYISLSLENCQSTLYDTERLEHSILLYSALAENIKAPLLLLDIKRFDKNIASLFDYELFKYLSLDQNYNYKETKYSKHIEAKELIKNRKYKEALALMHEIEEEKTPESYNAYLVFGIYTDMESCYKQLADFENAYRYASKRLSLIEGFES